MIAERDKKWVIQNWNEPFEVFENLTINLEELIKEAS